MDEDGNELPPMNRGELQIKGISVIRGYWQRPDANAATFDGRWLRTGDVAYIDEEGYLYIVDRIKDYSDRLGGRHWELSPLLERLAADGGSLAGHQNG